MDTGTHRPASSFIMVTLRFAAASHVGPVREHNEDAHVAGSRLLVVADGVGGEAAGEVASALAAEALSRLADDDDQADPQDRLRDGFAEANRRIAESATENPDQQGMATTVTALLFTGDRLDIGHAGDSRAYRYRDGRLDRLTRDDSYVQELIEQGAIDVSDVAYHPYRSVVTKTLQGGPVEPTLTTTKVHPGDRYLVCSDGLSDVLDDDQIAADLADTDDPDQAVERLAARALDSGATDNVTVIVAHALE
jgi:serine/threonine protein phosphatase PrpC